MGKKFVTKEYYQDRKVEVWQRTYFTVKGESEKECDKFVKEMGQNNDVIDYVNDEDIDFVEIENTETLIETIEYTDEVEVENFDINGNSIE